MKIDISLLEEFGKAFVTEIRDEAIRYCRRLVNRPNPRAVQSQLLRQVIEPLTEQQREILAKQLIPLFVDVAYGQFFWMLQQKHDRVPLPIKGMSLVIRDRDGTEFDLGELDDGLAGYFDWWVELFNEEGVFGK